VGARVFSDPTFGKLYLLRQFPLACQIMHQLLKAVAGITVVGAISGIGYCFLSLWSAVRFLRTRESAKSLHSMHQPAMPPVSVLKPLKGIDPEIYDSLRSHCLQNYPEYEIIFGVSDFDDAAIEIVHRLQKEFPERAIQLLVCEKNLGTNPKVSNLAQMLPAARHDYLVINDSDIRVQPNYLSTVMPPLNDGAVGVVTCLYCGIAAPTMGSRMESLGISTDFFAGVLVAHYLERGLQFGFGSTLAFRRRDLEAIGGFQSIVDYLADDYELASRIAARGLRVHISDLVVQTFLPSYSLRRFFDHQLRWGRGVRECRPFGYAGLLFTFAIPWAIATVAVFRGPAWAWELLLAALVVRLAVAWTVGCRVLRDSQVLRWFWLIPVRDLIAPLVWLASFASRKVVWRGDQFFLRNGKLVRINNGQNERRAFTIDRLMS
jgi:ceramide glucosyltransferase